jgi:hypothetical protein
MFKKLNTDERSSIPRVFPPTGDRRVYNINFSMLGEYKGKFGNFVSWEEKGIGVGLLCACEGLKQGKEKYGKRNFYY